MGSCRVNARLLYTFGHQPSIAVEYHLLADSAKLGDIVRHIETVSIQLRVLDLSRRLRYGILSALPL